MRNKIGIIVPLKSNKLIKRVRSLDAFLFSWKHHTSGLSDVILVVPDEEENFYLNNSWFPLATRGIHIYLMPLKTVTETLNKVADEIKDDYEVVAFMNDDFVISSNNWEEGIIKWQEENKGICWGNDLIQGETLTTHFFMHNSIPKALGFVAPPCMQHFYIDNYWTDLGILIGKRKYFPNLVFEHRHYSVGKNVEDSVYKEGNSIMDQDRLAFDEYRANNFQLRDAEKIIEYQKKML